MGSWGELSSKGGVKYALGSAHEERGSGPRSYFQMNAG